MKRFADVSSFSGNMKIKAQSINSRNTLKANRKAANTLREYLKEKEMDTDFVKFTENQLAEILSHFYMDARRPDGEHYKSGSLQNFRYSLNRYLRSYPYHRHFDIIKDQTFFSANNNFRMAVAELQKMGRDKVEHRPLISEPDLRKLYEYFHYNCDTPVGLYNKVQFDIRLYFFRRGTENLNMMPKSALKVVCDPYSGLKYVTLSKDKAKNCDRDGNKRGTCAFSTVPNVMPQLIDTPLCPVKSFEKYLSKLHPLCDRLWQRPREAVSENEYVWFYNCPVGEKTIAGFMKKISRNCGLSMVYTNHSIRATGLSLMSQTKVNTTQGSSQNREADGRSSSSDNDSLQLALCDNPISSLLQSIKVDACPERKIIPEVATVVLSSSGDSSGDELGISNQSEAEDSSQNDKNRISSVNKGNKKMLSNSSFTERNAMKSTNLSRSAIIASMKQKRRLKHGSNSNNNRSSSGNVPRSLANKQLEQNTTLISGDSDWPFDNFQSEMDASTSQNYLNPSSSSPSINSYNLNAQNSTIDTKPITVNHADIKKQQLEFLEAQMHQADVEAKKRQAEAKKRQAELAEAKKLAEKLAEEERLRKEAENKVYKYMVLNHEKKVLETLRALWKGNQFCDATLQNEFISIPVHKIVLIACCPKILETYDYIMKDTNVQVCFPRKVTAEALKAFVDYLYNGSLNLSRAILESMEYLSGMLGLDEIRQLCNQFRSDMLNDSFGIPDKTIVHVNNPHEHSSHQMSYNDHIVPPPPIVRPSTHGVAAPTAVSIQLSNFQDATPVTSVHSNNFNLFSEPHADSVLTEVSHIKLEPEPEVDLTAEDCTEIKQESLQSQLYEDANCKFEEWPSTVVEPHHPPPPPPPSSSSLSQPNFVQRNKNNFEMSTGDLSLAPLNAFQKQTSNNISRNISSGVITISPSNSPCPSPGLAESPSDIQTLQISNTHTISTTSTNPFPVSLISTNGQSISLTDQDNKRKHFADFDSKDDRKRSKIILN